MGCTFCDKLSDCKEYFVYTARELYSHTSQGGGSRTTEAAYTDFARHSFQVCKACQIRYLWRPLLAFGLCGIAVVAIWLILGLARPRTDTFFLGSAIVMFGGIIFGILLLQRFSLHPKLQARALAARQAESTEDSSPPTFIIMAKSFYDDASSGEHFIVYQNGVKVHSEK